MSSQLINRVLELTNAERAKAGLGSLRLSNQLAQAAQGHSDSMATDDFFNHTGADGSSVSDRVNDTGYVFARTGENIAAGQTTAEQVVEGWMNSPGHRANILNGAYTEIGIGYEYLQNDTGSVNYNHYWTQVFGTPQGNANQVNTPQPTQPIETDNEPVPVADNSNNSPEPEVELAPQEPLQPEKPVLNEEPAPQVEELIEIEPAPVENNNIESEVELSPQEPLQPEKPVLEEELAPQVEELIEIEPAPVTEEQADSPVEVLDNNTNDLEPSNKQGDSWGKDFDFDLFGAEIGNFVSGEADYQSGDVTGSAESYAVAGGDAVMSFGQGTDSSSDKFESLRQHYADITDMYRDSMGTSEFGFDDYKSDLIDSIVSSDFSSSHEQKAIAAVESFF